MSDPRITLADPSLAPLYIGSVMSPSAPLFDNNSLKTGLQTELLYGQSFRVYKEEGDGVWGQAVSLLPDSQRAGYIGFIPKVSLSRTEIVSTHSVSVLRALVFSAGDIKSPILMALPLNARVKIIAENEGKDGAFLRTTEDYFIHKNHMRALSDGPMESDFVAVAEAQMGAPYVWGGTGLMGLDCSGLVQMSLCAVGQDAPRDADMQEAALGTVVNGPLKRGDLIFWPGHVGIMSDADTLLHANAFHMKTEKEPYAKAKARIGDPRFVKRL